jgi:hypothetical protein
MEFLTFVDTLGSLGNLGILLFLLWAFFSGKIVPIDIADKRAETAEKIAEKALSNGLRGVIKSAVKEGYIEAYYELKSMGERMILCPFDIKDITEKLNELKERKKTKTK